MLEGIPRDNAGSFFNATEWHLSPFEIIKRITCFSRFELCCGR